METLWQDTKYSGRKLLRSPGFALVTLLTLALGIGANSAIFSVVHAVMLRPLPFAEPDELVMVWERNFPRNIDQNVASAANYLEWRDRQTSFEAMAAMVSTGVVLSGEGRAERVQAGGVTPSFFEILGAEAALGRVFTAEEGVPGNDDVVVLGHGLWQARFGGDPDVVGRRILLNGTPHTVVGVMPPGFEGLRFKPRMAAFASDWTRKQELWAPLALGEEARESIGRSLFVLARLKDEVGVEQADSEMSAIAARLAEEHEYDVGWGTNVVPLHQQVVGEAGTALVVLLAAVGFILLIACANVANLLLARASNRRREIAVRAAMGAGRGRIVRQLLTESLLLGVLGGAIGLVLAIWGVEALTALSPGDIPRLEEVGVSGPVLAFTAGVSLLAALLFGAIPALQASRPDVQGSLKEGGRGATEVGGRRARSVLVVAEIALAAVLVIGASLIVRSFWELNRVDPGFDTERVISGQLMLRGEDYRGVEARARFAGELLERVRALPGVNAAALTVARPLGGGLAPATSFRPIDRPEPEVGDWPVTDVRMVSPDYFRTMGITLHRGREFDERDGTEAPPVVIVNETLARTYWPDGDPIGKQLIVRMGDETPREIVGVAEDVRHASLDAAPRAKVYYPHSQLSFPWVDLVVRTDLDAAAVVTSIRRELRALDPNLPFHSIQPMDEVVSASIADERFNMTLLTLFAMLALLLATIGIYGVMSYTVTRRTHEIGIRLALGAERGAVMSAVVKEGMILAAVGLILGTGAALVLTQLLSSLLYEVGARDPLTFVTVTLVLALTALAACTFPALRATRVDPMLALRYE